MDSSLEFNKKWTNEFVKLLVSTRIQFEPDFRNNRRKKKVLWRVVLEEIKKIKPEFGFSVDEITRKFLNLKTTYKRIKNRNCTTGEAATSWEFYADFDNVYGTRHSVVVPPDNVDASLEESDENNVDYFEEVIDDPEASEARNFGPPHNKKRKKTSELIDFIQSESDKDREYLKQLVDIESARLKVDQERVEEMRELKGLLIQLIN